ncbi:TlpA disulfide reductase family protein [Salibacterium halotolerans]|uniref:Peroxiredoxin n=1 Tax=Salibacterium halotolerans TaxID=1884432 RepID=A0A1I5QBM9_9BACI|nr:TlpA disulfide reductase family protein [Salibacterium halotolerans]SFP43441.1 Peroxiredoxin [Salibacterium halotolerans]
MTEAKAAPDFELSTLDGEDQVRFHDWKGKPVMLTFWASWCPDSQRDLAKKQSFYENLDQDKIQFLTINVTGREGSTEAPVQFMEDNGYTFPVLRDLNTKTYDKYQCMGVPTTFILDENLQVMNRFNDKAAFVDIIKGVEPLLVR